MDAELASSLETLAIELYDAMEEDDAEEVISIVGRMEKKLKAIREEAGEAPTPTEVGGDLSI